MTKYRIKVSVSIEPVNSTAGEARTSTSVEELVDKGVAWSIDDCEDAVVRLGFEAMRREMAEHLEAVSKKGLNRSGTGRL